MSYVLIWYLFYSYAKFQVDKTSGLYVIEQV